MSEKSKEFGIRLSKLISERKLNPNSFAKLIGKPHATIWAYVNEGRIPEAPILYRLSQSLGVTMEYLLTGDGGEQKQPILLNKMHSQARDFLDHIFSSRNEKTKEAIFSNLEQFSKLVDLETSPGEEEEKASGGGCWLGGIARDAGSRTDTPTTQIIMIPSMSSGIAGTAIGNCIKRQQSQ